MPPSPAWTASYGATLTVMRTACDHGGVEREEPLRRGVTAVLDRADDLDDRVEATALALRAAAVEAANAHHWRRPGRREPALRALLGIEAETLAKKRQEGKGPPSYRVPVGPARVSYRLADLAQWIERCREDY